MSLLYKFKFPVTLTVIVLYIVSTYCIADYVTSFSLIDNEIFSSIFMASNILFSLSPLVIFLFLCYSQYLILHDIFELPIKFNEAAFITSKALIPVVLSLYFVWYNYITFPNSVKELNQGFSSAQFLFGLTINDLKIINNSIWIITYFIMIISWMHNRIPFFKSIIATLLPTFLLIIFASILRIW